MRIIAKWIIVAIAFLSLPQLIPGIAIASFQTALVVALFWGLANLVLRPILLLVFLPITILTLGLFTFVVNTGLFWLISSFVKGFYVDGFVPALFGSLVVSVAAILADKLLSKS